MPSMLNRRAFTLAALATAGAFISHDFIPADEESPISQNTFPTEKQKVLFEPINRIPPIPDNYVRIIERRKRKNGFRVATIEYYLEKKLWISLPHDLEKKEFYDTLKNAPFKNQTTIELSELARKKAVTTQEFLDQFLVGADIFIQNTTNGNYYPLDPSFRFDYQDKKILEGLLLKKLKSPAFQKVEKYKEKVYVYPHGTKIMTEVDYVDSQNPSAGLMDPTITLYVKFPDDHKYLYGKRKMTLVGVDEKTRLIEKDIFMKMQQGILLTRDFDHSPKTEIYIPIDEIYKKYLQRE